MKEKATLKQADVIRFLADKDSTFNAARLEQWAKRGLFDVTARSGGRKIYGEADLVALYICLAAMPVVGSTVTKELLAYLARDPKCGEDRRIILANPGIGEAEVDYVAGGGAAGDRMRQIQAQGRSFVEIPVWVFLKEVRLFMRDGNLNPSVLEYGSV